MLIMVCGLPGTGKSTIAKALASKFSAEYLNSDVIRKKLFPKQTYTEEEKLAVYRKMADEAESLLEQNKDVILDATFSKKEYVRLVEQAVQRAGDELHIVLCTLSDDVVKRRIEQREKGPSDADFKVYLKLKKELEPIKGQHLVLDASKPINELVRTVEFFVFGSMDEKKVEQLCHSLGKNNIVTTHISWVLVGKDFVYKIKRPVKFSFLDFTTLAKRKLFCEEEVRLNKRLAPDVYVGVVPVTKDKDSIALGGKGKIIDYAVKMKTLPQDRRMDLLLKQGQVTSEHIKKIAGIVADFHKKIDVIKDARYSSADVVKIQIDDLANFRSAIEGACGMGAKVDFVVERSDSFIEKNKELFMQRQKEGRIRDCHGDLHSANIFIIENGEIVIFDCIEFNKDFRYVDVASEIAFMAMDLDAFGRDDLSQLFVSAYLSKTQDPGFETLLGLYECYRANVRAKVAAIEYSGTKSDEAKERISKYMLLAERYAKEL